MEFKVRHLITDTIDGPSKHRTTYDNTTVRVLEIYISVKTFAIKLGGTKGRGGNVCRDLTINEFSEIEDFRESHLTVIVEDVIPGLS